MPLALTSSSSAYRNWTSAVRRATPWAHSWKVQNERRLYGRAQLPNERLKEIFDGYKKRNWGNAPNLFTGIVRGRDIYIFSVTHGLNAPASVFIHDRSGKYIDGAGN